MDCPYAAFDPATIAFCEERLCAWVAEPANAFTSLTKTAVGVAILAQAMARGVRDARLLIGVAAVVQGPMGFSLHASGTFFGEFLDVSGMFVLGGILVTFALGRLLRWSRVRHLAFFFLMQTSCMGLLAAIRPIGITLFVLQLIAWAVVEVLLTRDGRPRADYRGLRGMLLSLSIGFGFWVLDKTGAWCDPQNHVINGHAIWHVLTSLTVWFFWVDQRELAADPLAGASTPASP
jgi:hypothetical protein